MTRACLAAVLLVAATAATSSAGTYVGLGVGSSASVSVDMTWTTLSGDGDKTGRLILGQRFGRLSIEGNVVRYGVLQGTARSPDDVTSLAAAAKLSFPLGNNLEAFGRLGVQRSWLSTSSSNRDMSGSGYLFGAGFEYRLDLGVGAGSIFVDYTRTDTGFQDSIMRSADTTTGMWTLGLIVQI